jgi:hypothetical protein
MEGTVCDGADGHVSTHQRLFTGHSKEIREYQFRLRLILQDFLLGKLHLTLSLGRNFTQRFFVVCPYLQSWPMPRSIVILDNDKIHMYHELEKAIHKCGAMLPYLPPYSPQMNPIEKSFSLLKQWLTKYADMVFRVSPEKELFHKLPYS